MACMIYKNNQTLDLQNELPQLIAIFLSFYLLELKVVPYQSLTGICIRLSSITVQNYHLCSAHCLLTKAVEQLHSCCSSGRTRADAEFNCQDK